MSNECDQKVNSPFPIVECSESELKIPSNVQVTELDKIKQEPTDNPDNDQNTNQGSFEFVEVETKQDTFSAIELKDEEPGKIKQEPTDNPNDNQNTNHRSFEFVEVETNTLSPTDLKVEENIETEQSTNRTNLLESLLNTQPDQTNIDSNVEMENLLGTIKQEHIDNRDNNQNSTHGRFEHVEWKLEKNHTSTSLEVKVEEKIEIEDPDCTNLIEVPLKIDPDQIDIDRISDQKKKRKIPRTKTGLTNKSQFFHCEYCDYTSKLKTILMKHINRVHLKIQSYKCDICGFQCADNNSLKSHKSLHSQKCKFCDYIGINQKELFVHRIRNHTTTYKCRFCDYVVKNKTHLNMHENGIHLKKETYSCPDCSYTTLYKPNMWIHKKRKHVGDICFNCDKCDYKSKTKECLKRHVNNIHANHGFKHKCRFCDYVTKDKRHLDMHENGIHLKKVRYSCPDCSYTTLYESNMRMHKKRKHERIYFNCDQCDFKTKIKEYLKRHKNAIHESQIFHCEYCDYATNRMDRVKKHVNGVHLKNYQYKCDSCSFQCVEENNLKHHKSTDCKTSKCDYIEIKIEEPLTPRIANYNIYKCQFCDYVAKNKTFLNIHENGIHLKKVRYSCPDCSYTALYKSSITIHKKLKHEENYFNCDKCDFKTKTKGCLKRHIKAIHPTLDEKSQIFHCEHCDYTAKQMYAVKMHINGVHLKNYPYKCDLCSFRSLVKLGLERHKSTHFKKCKYCDFVGIDKKALSAHSIANHSKCRFCDYTNERKVLLENHENAMHLKEPIRCDHCDYTCTTKPKLTAHLRQNHALVERFKCEKCDFACKERSELSRHIKVEHEKNNKYECYDCGFLTKTKLKLENHILARHLKKRRFQCKFCSYGAITKSRIFEHAEAKHKKAFVKKKLKGELVFWKELNL